MCDHLLGEAGRRHHMFTWLRAPGASTGEWLAVDAYYPRARLVVMCGSRPGAHDALYRELVPAHGLGLLTLDPAVLGNDREAVRQTLAAKFFDLEPVPRGRPARTAMTRDRPARTERTGDRPARTAMTRDRPARTERIGDRPARTAMTRDRPAWTATTGDRPAPPPPARGPASQSARETAAEMTAQAAEDPARGWTPVKVERTSVPRGFVQALGVLAGLAFAALLIVELYFGVIKVAFGAGRVVLGLAILLEALSRALGTVAAERAGRRGWACACAIVGAPVVAWVALMPRSGRIEAEPAPLAGRLAVLAGMIALVGFVTGT